MLGSFGNLCCDGAFLAYIQEKKMEKEDEVQNAFGSTFYRKENASESINKRTNPLLVLLFHTNNCPEDGVLQ